MDTLPPTRPEPAASAPVRWSPDRSTPGVAWPVPPLSVALLRGFRRRCPACGKSHLFTGYLTVEPACPDCGAPVGRARADDAPPYFTIVVVGHIVIPLMLLSEQRYSPPVWVTAAVFLPMTVILCLALLPLIKGATVGLMLKLGMMKTADE